MAVVKTCSIPRDYVMKKWPIEKCTTFTSYSIFLQYVSSWSSFLYFIFFLFIFYSCFFSIFCHPFLLSLKKDLVKMSKRKCLPFEVLRFLKKSKCPSLVMNGLCSLRKYFCAKKVDRRTANVFVDVGLIIFYFCKKIVWKKFQPAIILLVKK